jgi:ParB family chromosome partitioning protein
MSPRRRRSEPYQIKGVDALFGDDSSAAAVTSQEVPIQQLKLPQQQPRRYFDDAALQDLVISVQQHGILQPLLVRPLKDSGYEVVAGERRLRAAQKAGLSSVPVIVRDLNEREALQVALLENLQREDLNPVEETEGILSLLELVLELSRDQVIELFNKAAHPDRDSVDNVIHSDQWQVITSALQTIGRFTPESFRTNRIPLLSLPEDVLIALRDGRLAYTKARAIARVKDTAQRQTILAAAIAENLSLSQLKERIADLAPSTPPQGQPSLRQEIDTVYRQVKKSKVWDNPRQQKRLKKILTELRSLLEEGER